MDASFVAGECNHYLGTLRCRRGASTPSLTEHEPDAVNNLAAESHVDRSIDAPGAFFRANVDGTHVLPEAALLFWLPQAPVARSRFRFHQVSTDEVYGDLAEDTIADEETR